MKAVRIATIADLPQIRDLAHLIWPVAYGSILSEGQLSYMLEKMYSITSLKQQMIENGHQFVIVLQEDSAVGFASFSPKVAHPGVIRLHKIYILPSEQGKGTGKFLLEYIRNASRKMKGHTLQLNVNRHNPALHFYEKSGFTIVGQEDIDIGHGYFMNDYIMEAPCFNPNPDNL